MVQLSMLLKLLKNMVIILALMIMRWIILKIKCCPSPVYKEERVQKGTLHIAIGHDDDLLTKTAHYHIVRKIQKKCADVNIEFNTGTSYFSRHGGS